MPDYRESQGENRAEHEEVHLLKEILHEERRVHSILERILAAIIKTTGQVASFRVLASLIGANMNIGPGQATVLTATPLDAGGVPTSLPSGDVPNWSVSDASQVVAVPSADGLSLSVTVNNPAPIAGDVVFTVTDSVIATAVGTITLTITPGGGPGANPVASFSIAASTPARKR